MSDYRLHPLSWDVWLQAASTVLRCQTTDYIHCAEEMSDYRLHPLCWDVRLQTTFTVLRICQTIRCIHCVEEMSDYRLHPLCWGKVRLQTTATVSRSCQTTDFRRPVTVGRCAEREFLDMTGSGRANLIRYDQCVFRYDQCWPVPAPFNRSVFSFTEL